MTVIAPVRTRCPAGLVEGIRAATREHADWQHTAELVARELEHSLPGPEVLEGHLARIRDGPASDPSAAITSSKNLLESPFRMILQKGVITMFPLPGAAEPLKCKGTGRLHQHG